MQIRPLTGCRRVKPSDLLPKGLHAGFGTCENAASSDQTRGFGPQQDPLSFRSRKQQQIPNRMMQIPTWLAVVLLTARTPQALAAPGSGAQPSSSRPLWGPCSPFCPHPQTSAQDVKGEKGWKLPGCFTSTSLSRARGRAGSGCACGRARDPCAKPGITVQEQRAPRFLRDYRTKAAAFN